MKPLKCRTLNTDIQQKQHRLDIIFSPCLLKNKYSINYTYCSSRYSLIYKLSQYKLNTFFRFNNVISSVFNVQKVHIYYLKTTPLIRTLNWKSFLNIEILVIHSNILKKTCFYFVILLHINTHNLSFGIKQQCFREKKNKTSLCNCYKVKRNLYNKKYQKAVRGNRKLAFRKVFCFQVILLKPEGKIRHRGWLLQNKD